MDALKQPVFDTLEALGIRYDAYEHPPVFTSEDADKYWRDIPATPVKNLFLGTRRATASTW